MGRLLPPGHPFESEPPHTHDATSAPLRAAAFFPGGEITQNRMNFLAKHMAGGPNGYRQVIWEGVFTCTERSIGIKIPPAPQRFEWVAGPAGATIKRGDGLILPPVDRNENGQAITAAGGLAKFQPMLSVTCNGTTPDLLIRGYDVNTPFIFDGNFSNQLQPADITGFVFGESNESDAASERRFIFEQSHTLSISAAVGSSIGASDNHAEVYWCEFRDGAADDLKVGAGGGSAPNIWIDLHDLSFGPRTSDVRASIALGGLSNTWLWNIDGDDTGVRYSRIESETEQTPTSPVYYKIGFEPDGTPTGNITIGALELGGGANTDIRDSLIYDIVGVETTVYLIAGRCTATIHGGTYRCGETADLTGANFRMATINLNGGTFYAAEDRGWRCQWGVAGIQFEGGSITVADGVTFPIEGVEAGYDGPVFDLNNVSEANKAAVSFSAVNLNTDARATVGLDTSGFPGDRLFIS